MKKIERTIHQIDATDKIVGRLATEIAMLLRGKNKPSFEPHTDCGDIVEVSNCAKLKFSGKKEDQKLYYWHTNYPGGIKSKTAGDTLKKNPGEVLRRAVNGMLPKNKLRDQMLKRLKLK
ncbi:MAG: 50S ribosomal protein L13 [bacterium]